MIKFIFLNKCLISKIIISFVEKYIINFYSDYTKLYNFYCKFKWKGNLGHTLRKKIEISNKLTLKWQQKYLIPRILLAIIPNMRDSPLEKCKTSLVLSLII